MWGRKLTVCLLICHRGFCQPVQQPSENAYINAGAYSEHFTDAFSFRSNAACLGNIQRFSAGILTERKWMLKELSQYTAAASFNLGKGGLGISLQKSGDVNYSEQGIDLAYGKNLGRMEAGVRFGYFMNRAAGYPGAGFGSAGFAMRFHISGKLITGWEIKLPAFRGGGKSAGDKGARVFSMGWGYEINASVFLALQIEKATGRPVNIISTVEYRYGEQFFFSFGLNSDTGSPYFKTGWKKNHLCIQLYTVYDAILGFSPGLAMFWESKNKKG